MSYYADKLEQGAQYQDFITDVLSSQYGISLNAYSSKKYQYERGESASGIEVKFDDRMHETGNVYIEIAEKSHSEIDDYTPSGICRNDNTWLYLIGDYKKALLMSKKQLRLMVEKDDDLLADKRIFFKQTPTSRGYVFPVEYCKKFLCIRLFDFEG